MLRDGPGRIDTRIDTGTSGREPPSAQPAETEGCALPCPFAADRRMPPKKRRTPAQEARDDAATKKRKEAAAARRAALHEAPDAAAADDAPMVDAAGARVQHGGRLAPLAPLVFRM